MLLPSDIARLVLGYLQQEGLTASSRAFICESPNLKEYAEHSSEDGILPACVFSLFGKSLITILNEYVAIKAKDTSHENQIPVVMTSLWKKLDVTLNQIKSLQNSHTVQQNQRLRTRFAVQSVRRQQRAVVPSPTPVALPVAIESLLVPGAVSVPQGMLGNPTPVQAYTAQQARPNTLCLSQSGETPLQILVPDIRHNPGPLSPARRKCDSPRRRTGSQVRSSAPSCAAIAEAQSDESTTGNLSKIVIENAREKILNDPSLQEKLAENINKILASDCIPPMSKAACSTVEQEQSIDEILGLQGEIHMTDDAIQDILTQTESDPAFQALFDLFDCGKARDGEDGEQAGFSTEESTEESAEAAHADAVSDTGPGPEDSTREEESHPGKPISQNPSSKASVVARSLTKPSKAPQGPTPAKRGVVRPSVMSADVPTEPEEAPSITLHLVPVENQPQQTTSSPVQADETFAQPSPHAPQDSTETPSTPSRDIDSTLKEAVSSISGHNVPAPFSSPAPSPARPAPITAEETARAVCSLQGALGASATPGRGQEGGFLQLLPTAPALGAPASYFVVRDQVAADQRSKVLLLPQGGVSSAVATPPRPRTVVSLGSGVPQTFSPGSTIIISSPVPSMLQNVMVPVSVMGPNAGKLTILPNQMFALPCSPSVRQSKTQKVIPLQKVPPKENKDAGPSGAAPQAPHQSSQSSEAQRAENGASPGHRRILCFDLTEKTTPPPPPRPATPPPPPRPATPPTTTTQPAESSQTSTETPPRDQPEPESVPEACPSQKPASSPTATPPKIHASASPDLPVPKTPGLGRAGEELSEELRTPSRQKPRRDGEMTPRHLRPPATPDMPSCSPASETGSENSINMAAHTLMILSRAARAAGPLKDSLRQEEADAHKPHPPKGRKRKQTDASPPARKELQLHAPPPPPLPPASKKKMKKQKKLLDSFLDDLDVDKFLSSLHYDE